MRAQTRALWNMLLDAQRAVHRVDNSEDFHDAQLYRNGIMDAYVLVAQRDPEEVYENMQDILQAEHERAIAEGE